MSAELKEFNTLKLNLEDFIELLNQVYTNEELNSYKRDYVDKYYKRSLKLDEYMTLNRESSSGEYWYNFINNSTQISQTKVYKGKRITDLFFSQVIFCFKSPRNFSDCKNFRKDFPQRNSLEKKSAERVINYFLCIPLQSIVKREDPKATKINQPINDNDLIEKHIISTNLRVERDFFKLLIEKMEKKAELSLGEVRRALQGNAAKDICFLFPKAFPCYLKAKKVIYNLEEAMKTINSTSYTYAHYFQLQDEVTDALLQVMEHVVLPMALVRKSNYKASFFDYLMDYWLELEYKPVQRMLLKMVCLADARGELHVTKDELLQLMGDGKYQEYLSAYLMEKNPASQSQFANDQLFQSLLRVKDKENEKVYLEFSIGDYLEHFEKNGVQLTQEEDLMVKKLAQLTDSTTLPMAGYPTFCFAENGYAKALVQQVKEDEITLHVDFNALILEGEVIYPVPKFAGLCYSFIPPKDYSLYSHFLFNTLSPEDDIVAINVEFKNEGRRAQFTFQVDIQKELTAQTLDLKRIPINIIENIQEICFVFTLSSFRDIKSRKGILKLSGVRFM